MEPPGPLVTVVLPAALAAIMLGLGLTLTVADFRRVLEYPRAVFTGLLVQALLLPAFAFGLAHAFQLPPWYALGFVLLAASPGGPSANLYSHLAGGDVALNLTLTAVNSVLSVITLPLIVGLGVEHFLGTTQHIPVQTEKIVQVVLIVLIPVALGMVLRRRAPALAARAERPLKILSVLFLAAVVVGAVAQERSRLGALAVEVGLPALIFNLVSLAAGYLVPRALRLPPRQATAIALEIGVHNGMLAMTVAQHVLGDVRMAVPAAIYSLIMYVTSGLFVVAIRER